MHQDRLRQLARSSGLAAGIRWARRLRRDAQAVVARNLAAIEAASAYRWAEKNCRPLTHFAESLEPTLWLETERFAMDLENRHAAEFEHLRRTIRLGGGADYRLLYFLTRLTRPEVVVETGVAAGWSSAAILRALQVNGSGRLWSSELVYSRPTIHADYRPFVGMVVDEDLKDRWTLLLEGDRVNLPRIVTDCGPIDLFHFDSDKSFAGREFAFDVIRSRLAENAIVMFDDITDNLHFRRLARRPGSPWVVTGPRASVGVIWEGIHARVVHESAESVKPRGRRPTPRTQPR